MPDNINLNQCLVQRDFVAWGWDDRYDVCHNVHHYVPWTILDYSAAVFCIAMLVLVVLGFFAMARS
jgi:hypothetical protein